MENLRKVIKNQKFDNEFSHRLLNFEYHFRNIFEVCSFSFEKNCGSYLFDGLSYEYQIETYEKQKLLYEKSKNKKNILEIGTYMGHSLLLILMANPSVKITCIDINDEYSLPAITYLRSKFPMSQISFLKGNSIDVLKKINEKFDLFHIDGAHKNKIVTKEFYYCMNLIKSNDIDFIFDDKANIQVLLRNIKEVFTIREIISPDCPHSNIFLNIVFPVDKFLMNYKKMLLMFKSNFNYIISKLKKFLKFKKI